MQTEFSVDIDPAGVVRMIYQDDSPLRELGRIRCERVSNVIFNQTTELWQVEILKGKLQGTAITDPSWTNRADAIAWELDYFEKNFSDLLDNQESIC